VRDAVKEAKLQNPALTNRNCIRGCLEWVSKHNIAKPATNKFRTVDAAGVGGRQIPLPGEVSLATSSQTEKSAEAILAERYEPDPKRKTGKTGWTHRNSEGPNIKQRLCRTDLS
jgi:hypothetical protein